MAHRCAGAGSGARRRTPRLSSAPRGRGFDSSLPRRAGELGVASWEVSVWQGLGIVKGAGRHKAGSRTRATPPKTLDPLPRPHADATSLRDSYFCPVAAPLLDTA